MFPTLADAAKIADDKLLLAFLEAQGEDATDKEAYIEQMIKEIRSQFYDWFFPSEKD